MSPPRERDLVALKGWSLAQATSARRAEMLAGAGDHLTGKRQLLRWSCLSVPGTTDGSVDAGSCSQVSLQLNNDALQVDL